MMTNDNQMVEATTTSLTVTVDTLSAQLASIDAEIAALTANPVVDMTRHNTLTKQRAAIVRMRNDYAKIQQAEARKQREIDAEAAEAEVLEALIADIRAWIVERDICFVLSTNKFWIADHSGWFHMSEQAIKTERPSLRNTKEYSVFINVLRDEGRYYDRQTYTFRPTQPNVLNMLRLNFVDQVRDGQEPHWFFNMVIESIGGGKAENIDHVERMVVRKYQRPEDLMIPALVLQDNGGTGKGLFVSCLLSTIFSERGVADNLGIGDVIGKFNAKLMGRAVWFVNEAARGKYDLDDLKRKIGSTSFTVEPKGVDAFDVDMTAWCIMAGNDEAGSVKLSGDGVDRRWSIVKGGEPIVNRVAERLGVSVAEASGWIANTGAKVLCDPIEAGRWIAAKCDQYGAVEAIQPLHGRDYADVVETQKDIVTLLCEAVFLNPDFHHIKTSTLYDAYRHFLGRSAFAIARGTFYAKVEAWAKKNNVLIDRKMFKIGGGRNASKLSFFTVQDLAGRLDGDDDDRFFERTPHGSVSWLIDIG